MICDHGKIKSMCIECNPSAFCAEHKVRKIYCKICSAHTLCPHNKFKERCKLCRTPKAEGQAVKTTRPKTTERCPHGKKRRKNCTYCNIPAIQGTDKPAHHGFRSTLQALSLRTTAYRP